MFQFGGQSRRKTEFFADQAAKNAKNTANPVDVSNPVGSSRRPGFTAGFPTGFKATWIPARQGRDRVNSLCCNWRLNVPIRRPITAQDRILRRPGGKERKEHSGSCGRFESCGKLAASGIHGGVSHRIQSDMDRSAAGPRPSEFVVLQLEVECSNSAANHGARQNSSPTRRQRTQRTRRILWTFRILWEARGVRDSRRGFPPDSKRHGSQRGNPSSRRASWTRRMWQFQRQSRAMKRGLALDKVVLLGRTLEEYRRYFALDLESLRGKAVLDVASGVSSFCAEAQGLGLEVMAFDSFFFSSRRRHTRSTRDWSADVCSSDLRRSRSSWCSRWRCRESSPGSR